MKLINAEIFEKFETERNFKEDFLEIKTGCGNHLIEVLIYKIKEKQKTKKLQFLAENVKFLIGLAEYTPFMQETFFLANSFDEIAEKLAYETQFYTKKEFLEKINYANVNFEDDKIFYLSTI